ncbi:multidrug effflux MFS transporter [Bacteroidales bacterium OttesenSCG-928-B11]|nr:multidrug effflux MFS transporter [Bacteroidales bacterium OttesenSCG-928-E04]MDL2308142.1 multidrug effflux MFS transporter [Bacteroidales bacterium OttesenSCG-928-C03]MDL2311503.1 multidrug effflux MFS transporter [Bacteroidales bacterium OttesenSCG-928-B11]MDL2325568.1 multidrug effflux MFS transporter [Bacteroidales bacterium OttesenSCG-928-A14]
MKEFGLTQWVIISILSLLTALEPLSIDLYLPGFILISESFSTPISSVQISLSAFLLGFALGQLFWGPLADRFGRKKPILASLAIFIVASIACIYAHSIEQFWVFRFIQAIGGCGGVVISRAVVTDYFESSKTLKIFSLLALIMGVAPIIAPTIGNTVINAFSWEGAFFAMLFLGVLLFFLTLFFLPETHRNSYPKTEKNVFKGYFEILKIRKFLIYSILGGIANGALMIYVGNGPFLIMEKGGFSNNMFSLIFGTNALGLMIASSITPTLQRQIPTEKLVKYALTFMFGASIILLGAMLANTHIHIILAILFLYVFPIGILLPTTTELAITPFIENSGTASALYGSIQLSVAFICSMVSNYMSNGTLIMVGTAFVLCSTIGFALIFTRINLPEKSKIMENPM